MNSQSAMKDQNSLSGSNEQEEGMDFVGFLLRRKSLIILFALLGTGLAYLYFERQTPRYRSTVLVQVIHTSVDKTFSGILTNRDLSDAAFVITSPSILTPAVEKHHINNLQIFRGLTVEDTVSRLSLMISVRTPPGSNVVEISCESSNPEETALIANAVGEQYVLAQKDNYTDARIELETLLTKARNDVHSELKDKEDDYNKFRANSKLMSDGQNPHRTRHQNLLDEISKLRIQETQVEARLTSLTAALESGSHKEALRLLAERSGIMTSTEKVEEKSSAEDESARISEEQFLRAQADYEKAVAEAKRAEEEARLLSESEAANAELASRRYIQEQMFPLQLKLDQMRTKYGPDHPKVIEIQKEIETTRPQVMEVAALMKQKKTPVTPRIVPVPPKPITPKETPTNDQKKEQEDVAPEPILDPITVYQDSLKQELLTIQRNRTSLEEQAKSEETLARSLMQDEILEKNKIKEMDRLTQLFQGYLTKINETKVNADIGGVKSQILKPARYGWLVYPIMPQFIGMGAFLGGFLGMCIAYAVELADSSFRKPADIIREFGLPIVGHIPTSKEAQTAIIDGSKLTGSAISYHRPRSRAAEAFRSVRTAVCFNTLGSSHRVIQITSGTAGEGKSTLSLNLSIAMANSGKNTILVECDLRRPKVAKNTGCSSKYGIVNVLEGDMEVFDVIQGTEVKNLSILPGGMKTDNPAELFLRPEFGRLLQVLREKYDYVFLDTPPVLAVTDPCSVAAQVDGVIVVMRLDRMTRELGRRTLDQLRDVGARIFGLVINGVEEGDTYGYGAYQYNDYKSYSSSRHYTDSPDYFADGLEKYYEDSRADDADELLNHSDEKKAPVKKAQRMTRISQK